jgi:hypothetical protein
MIRRRTVEYELKAIARMNSMGFLDAGLQRMVVKMMRKHGMVSYEFGYNSGYHAGQKKAKKDFMRCDAENKK